MTQTELLQRIKESLQTLYGPRFRGLVLYGSVARGDAEEDSDIDLLCLLDGAVNTVKEISPIVDALSDLQREYLERMFDVTAVSAQDYEEGAFPLAIEAKREGALV